MINMFILFSSQILLCLGTVFPDSANLFADVLVRASATGFVPLGGYTFFYLAHVAAEVKLHAFHSATRAINALWCNLIGVIHLAPFLCNFDAHLVVVLYRGNASLTGLAVNATACNHLIHNSILLVSIVIHNTFFTPGIILTNQVSANEQIVVIMPMNINLPKACYLYSFYYHHVLSS
jgi:hypothetical protein